MTVEELGSSKLLNWLLKPAGWLMESPLRRLLHDPDRLLQGAGLEPRQQVLEVGSGTGFFTLPAARLLGPDGRLIAMEPLAGYVARLEEKLRAAGLANVQVMRRDALATGLDTASLDRVLLYGVVPFPSLPLSRLLPEMHRVLKPGGIMAVWLFPLAGLVPGTILRSGLFDDAGRRNGVYLYRPVADRG